MVKQVTDEVNFLILIATCLLGLVIHVQLLTILDEKKVFFPPDVAIQLLCKNKWQVSSNSSYSTCFINYKLE